MTKRFFSLLLSMAILFTVTRPAFAAGLDSDLQEETVSLGNESVVVHYQVNGKISYIEVGSDIIEVRGNEVYLNGEAGYIQMNARLGHHQIIRDILKLSNITSLSKKPLRNCLEILFLLYLYLLLIASQLIQPVRHSDLIFLQESLKIFITGHTTTLNEQKFMHLNISMDIKTGWAIYIKTNTSIMVTGLIHKKSVPKPCSLSGLSFSSSLLLFII